jgi:hypothetical protein
LPIFWCLKKIKSILTNIKNVDPENGVDYGKESLIVVPRPSRLYKPDREVAKLRAGADLSHIVDGKPAITAWIITNLLFLIISPK